MREIIPIFIFILLPFILQAEDGHSLWLRANNTAPVEVICPKKQSYCTLPNKNCGKDGREKQMKK